MGQTTKGERQLDALIRQLTPADRRWFEQLRMAMWLQGWLHDRAAMNTQLMAMGTDLLAAERDGLTAVTVFGQAPRAMANAVLAQLPAVGYGPRGTLAGLVVVTGLLLAMVVQAPLGAVMTLNAELMLGAVALTAAGCWGVVHALQQLPFGTRTQRWGSRCALVGVLALWVLGLAALVRWPLTVGQWALPWPQDVWLMGGLTVVAAIAWFWLAWRTHVKSLNTVAVALMWAGSSAVSWRRSADAFGPSHGGFLVTIYALFVLYLVIYLIVTMVKMAEDNEL